jgi:hypothetical protein
VAGFPNDADGDVLRRLESSGFDFGSSHEVDYIIDFKTWPPQAEAIQALLEFGDPEVFDPDDQGNGYVRVIAIQKLSYEAVTSMQARISGAMHRFSGVCEAWGVQH